MKKTLLLGVLILIAYFLLYPTKVKPVKYDLPTSEAEVTVKDVTYSAVLAKNYYGLEKVVFKDSVLYAFDRDQQLIKVENKQATAIKIDSLAQHIFGFTFKDNVFYAAGEDKVLVSIQTNGTAHTLADTYQGKRFLLVNDVASNDIDSKVWFTHSSQRYSVKDVVYDLIEMQPTGSVFSYDLNTQKLDEIASNLYWPNGITIDPSGEFVYYNTLYKRSVEKLWIKGTKKGEIETIAEGLPSYLDNISQDGQGNLWVAGVVKRNILMEVFHNQPWIRKIQAKLPMNFISKYLSQAKGKVYKINLATKAITQYNIKGKDASYLTNAVVHQDKLYVSGLRSYGVKVIDLNP